MQLSSSDLKRFWAKVKKAEGDGCWEWTACKSWNGYGLFRHEGKNLRAHRLSWFIAHNSWPVPQALHHCDNPACVRHDHLFEGTTKINMADKCSKKRQALHEGHGRSVLTTDQVSDIRRRHSAGEIRMDLAREFNVNWSTVNYVVKQLTWKDVS